MGGVHIPDRNETLQCTTPSYITSCRTSSGVRMLKLIVGKGRQAIKVPLSV